VAGRFEVYKDGKGEYRWRLGTGNGQVIATGGEGDTTKANAVGGIKVCSETHRSRRLSTNRSCSQRADPQLYSSEVQQRRRPNPAGVDRRSPMLSRDDPWWSGRR
jgi:uncharacterized protein YegP (UPF0339 family)